MTQQEHVEENDDTPTRIGPDDNDNTHDTNDTDTNTKTILL